MTLKNILQEDVLLIPKALINDVVISDKAKLIAFRLLSVGKVLNKEKVAKNANITVETLNKYIKELEARGWITLIKEPKKSDTYIFNYQPEFLEAPKIEPKKVKFKPNSTVLKECIDIYYKFYSEKVGIRPLIDGAGTSSIKKMIEFFTEEKAIESFKAMFENWTLIDDFLQNQLKPQQINSNLPNIINQIKNGYSKKQKPVTGDSKKTLTDKLKDW